MNKIKMVAIGLTTAFLLSACSITLPGGQATSNAIGNKVGTATMTAFFNIPFPFSQDAGVRAAAKNGGISKISTVDVQVYSLFNVIQRVSTVVTGS